GEPRLMEMYVLSSIALIILLISGMNFVTLSIGTSSKRAIEIGLRKVIGAPRNQIIRQLLTESLLLVTFAFILGSALTVLALPVFNELAEKSIGFSTVFLPINLLWIIVIIAAFGFSAGSYPAFIVSNLRIVEILKGKLKMSGKNRITRTLVTAQFACSVFLIIATLVMSKQINFFINMDLGFQKNNIIAVYMQDKSIKSGLRTHNLLREKLTQYSVIHSIASASNSFGPGGNFYDYSYNDEEFEANVMAVDHDYFPTLEIEFLQGRNFSREIMTDFSSIVVNESLVKDLELEEPVGKHLDFAGKQYRIIGVVNDNFTHAPQHGIMPTISLIDTLIALNFTLVKTDGNSDAETLTLLQDTWKEIHPDRPFLHSFLDEDVEAEFAGVRRWKAIIQYAAGFAVLIACMGIFGITALILNKRNKEICIRKVHGATTGGLFALLSRDYITWIVAANIIAWPAGWYIMNKWLDNFANKISLSPIVFIIPFFVIVALVMISISFQIIKAVRANPVDSLRYE
ncbi:ABC transporter permease, partial [candidate division KSB1 bacterium]